MELGLDVFIADIVQDEVRQGVKIKLAHNVRAV